ncbi:hypothetical protein SUGI_1198000 [Cryptomeria japonica]|nr:hypothetical protein SUGI_1198000 [Cryptomeria japonica]
MGFGDTCHDLSRGLRGGLLHKMSVSSHICLDPIGGAEEYEERKPLIPLCSCIYSYGIVYPASRIVESICESITHLHPKFGICCIRGGNGANVKYKVILITLENHNGKAFLLFCRCTYNVSCGKI